MDARGDGSYAMEAMATPQKMDGSIYVCPLSAVPDVVTRCNAARLLTCLQDEIVVETPAQITAGNHGRLYIHDISQPLAGCVLPGPEHVAQIIDFAREWGGQGPMVIHCWAGISRSTAAALISLCTLNPEVPEQVIAQHMRDASPTAYPNGRMIQLADEALGRGGRLVSALQSMGRGIIAAEAEPFSLPADFSSFARRHIA
jgi:predicted protein tyrosine phosphatase